MQKTDTNLLTSLFDPESLYQNAPCGYVTFLPDGTILKVNRTLLKWLDYQEDELLNTKLPLLMSKGGQMHFEMFLRTAIAVKGNVKELSYEFIKKSKQLLPALLTATSVKNEDGKVIAVNAVITDITERKLYEQELIIAKKVAEGEKKRFQFMADLVPEIIWTATPNGQIDYTNHRFFEYFGAEGYDRNHTFFLSKVHQQDQKKLMSNWSHSLSTNENLEIEVRLLNKNLIFEWHLIKAAPFLSEDRNLIKWFGSCANIHSHVQTIQKKDDFISIASHELKTPITTLKATLQLLSKIKDNPQPGLLGKLIDQSTRSMNKINDLIDDLLNTAQMGEGHLSISKTNFNIYQLLDGCCEYVRTAAKHQLITSGNQQLMVFADQNRIDQVILNFVNNAVKYAPLSKVVELNVEQQGDMAKISVTDFGPGIAPEKLPHLFERFFRADYSGSRYSGLGLGLYISAEIIKRHHGKIGVDSKPGQGSCFWFTLPLTANTKR